jgi:carbamoyl-phosphate synthase large subunit
MAERRLLVLGAGGGASNNLMRSLRAAEPGLRVVGCHADRFTLTQSPADRNYLVHPAAHPDFAATLRAVVERERIDLVVPNSDADVLAVSRARGEIGGRLFLPAHETIARCQDKYALTALLRDRGVPAPATCPVGDLDALDDLFRQFGSPTRLWCRMRTGTGSMGATPVAGAGQARSWIEYWRDMRGIPPGAFTLSEYLPGRDFAVQGLWADGALVLLKTCERLSYVGGASRPSGVSSTPALGKTVFDSRVAGVCERAIAALDPRASGVFSIDLKEDRAGVPCVTEVNAGRFCMITPVFDATGKHSMAAAYVRLAFGEPPDVADPYDVTGTHYLIRDVDTLPGIVQAEEIFDGIEDARA